MNEIALRDANALAEQMDYAKAVASGSLLPKEYQNSPANVLIAVGLGQSMGLSPAESLYRITVIQGKPTASAELIAANVRKAGHKLRVRGDEQSCTATIIRADDPDYEFTVTRDTEWARSMGLLAKDNYKKQPGTMLQWRAITAVARLACPEALYGVSYTSDEVIDERRQEVASEATPRVTVAEVMGQQVDTETGEVLDAEAVPMITSQQTKLLAVLMKEADLTDRSAALAYAGSVVGREISSRNELTADEASRVIDQLKADQQAMPADADDTDQAELPTS